MKDSAAMVRCDGLGCDETHPEHHDAEGEPGFIGGRWQGWLYLDINRADLIGRPLRFCRVSCLDWWIHQSTMLDKPMGPLEAGRTPTAGAIDEIAVRRVKR